MVPEKEKAMRLYLSGPMTKRVAEDFNKPAFKQAATILRFLDHFVIDPTEQPEGLTYRDYMRFDLNALMHVDALVVLPEWEKGPGSVVEVLTAVSVGLPVYSYNKASASAPLSLLYKGGEEWTNCVPNIRDVLRRADAG